MATKVYLRDDLPPIAPDANSWRAAAKTKGAANVQVNSQTATGPTAGVDVLWSAGGPRKWISNPLAAGVTIAGTITLNYWMREQLTSANAGAHAIIERRANDGSFISTVLDTEFGTEMPTTAAAQNWTGAPTSTVFNAGDRICIRVLANDAGGTMAGSRTWEFFHNGPTDGASGDTWVSFTEDFDFETNLRATQVPVEALVQPDAAKLRVTQAAVEALVQPDTAKLRVTQVTVEALVSLEVPAAAGRTWVSIIG